MKCPNCGKENAPAASFCGECGSALQPAAEEPMVSTVPPPVPPPQTNPLSYEAYAQTPQYYPPSQPPYVMDGASLVQAPRADGMCVAGMVLGIVALVFFWFPILSIVLGVLAATFGAVGMSNVNKNPGLKTGAGMGIAGLVCGIIAVIIAVIIIIIAASVVM